MLSPREVLIEALKDVEEAELPDDLREIGFAKAVDLRAGSLAAVPATPVVGEAKRTPDSAGSGRHGGDPVFDGDPIGGIATRLKIDRGTVSEIFAANNGDVELIVSAGRLSGKLATATKEIALLIAGGRQAAGLEEWTSWDEIRKWCGEFKKLDSGNFAKTMREMDDVFNTRKASERKLQVRLAKPGWERVADEIRRLGGE